jgi:putative flippase GtrA
MMFLLFGGLAALVNLACGKALYRDGLHTVLPYWLAVTLSASAGLLVNFGLNYHFNFRYRGRPAAAQLRTFCVVAVVGILLTSAISVAIRTAVSEQTLTIIGIGTISTAFASHFIAVGLVTFYSYAAHHYFTFNVGVRRRLSGIFGRYEKPNDI